MRFDNIMFQTEYLKWSASNRVSQMSAPNGVPQMSAPNGLLALEEPAFVSNGLVVMSASNEVH
eukprot:scaffold16260_cov58-Cyclotella_meneghiniana.AAC.3